MSQIPPDTFTLSNNLGLQFISGSIFLHSPGCTNLHLLPGHSLQWGK